jgi:hypothetical protein
MVYIVLCVKCILRYAPLITRAINYKINFASNCNLEGVVYLIISKQCKKMYVGSTITSFRKRF